MFKLVFFLIGLGVAVILSALNTGNTTDISFGFIVLKDVSVFFPVIISFLAGALFTLPFAFFTSMSNKKKSRKKVKENFIDDDLPSDFSPTENVPENQE